MISIALHIKKEVTKDTLLNTLADILEVEKETIAVSEYPYSFTETERYFLDLRYPKKNFKTYVDIMSVYEEINSVDRKRLCQKISHKLDTEVFIETSSTDGILYFPDGVSLPKKFDFDQYEDGTDFLVIK